MRITLTLDTAAVRRVLWRALRALGKMALWFGTVGSAMAVVGWAAWWTQRLFGPVAVLVIGVGFVVAGLALAFVIAYQETES